MGGNLKKKSIIIFITMLLLSFNIPLTFADSWGDGQYSGSGEAFEWNYECPDSWADGITDSGVCKVFAYGGGVGPADCSAWVYRYFTPAVTSTYYMGSSFYYNYRLRCGNSESDAWFRVYLRIENSGGLVREDMVYEQYKGDTSSPNPKTGSGTTTKYGQTVTLTGGTQYKLIVRSYAQVAWDADVGGSRDDPSYIDVSSISIQLSGGGCPTVSVWDGTKYLTENNILTKYSGKQSGEDLLDTYKINTPQASENNRYLLQIKETNLDHDYLDQIKLYAIDHTSETKISINSKGQINTYNEILIPKQVSVGKDDITDIVTSLDNSNVLVDENEYIYVDFGPLKTVDKARVLVQGELRKKSLSIQSSYSDGKWMETDLIGGRLDDMLYEGTISNWLPTSNGNYVLRLKPNGTAYLDYIALTYETQSIFTITEVTLKSAVHSSGTVVLNQLSNSDNTYAELLPGESITLEFITPKDKGLQRTWILLSEGYYITIK
jgi:hypothetical protein